MKEIKAPEGFEIAPPSHRMRTGIDIGTSPCSTPTPNSDGVLCPKGFEWAEEGGWGGSTVAWLNNGMSKSTFFRPIKSSRHRHLAIINYVDGTTLAVDLPKGWYQVTESRKNTKITRKGDKYYIPRLGKFVPTTYGRTDDKISSYHLVIRRSHKKKD